MMLYPSHIMANLIGSGQPVAIPGHIAKVIWLSCLAAGIMTAWDLAIDPIMSGPGIRAWVWEEGGPYFGIPLRNFLGWMLTAFAIDWSYRRFSQKTILHAEDAIPLGISMMPVIACVAMMLVVILSNRTEYLKSIALIAMGIPSFVAFIRIAQKSDSELDYYSQTKHPHCFIARQLLRV